MGFLDTRTEGKAGVTPGGKEEANLSWNTPRVFGFRVEFERKGAGYGLQECLGGIRWLP